MFLWVLLPMDQQSINLRRSRSWDFMIMWTLSAVSYTHLQCHDSLEEHSFRAYPCQLKQDKVLICGVCRHEMTIEEYQEAVACPNCHSAFNPACSKHYEIYFEK